MKVVDNACSYCNAAPGNRCLSPSKDYPTLAGARTELPYYHCERVDAAFEKLDQLTRKVMDDITAIFATEAAKMARGDD
ncbi:MAG TPA: hypothetical protein VMR29_10795 [Candidatus Binatia bacterium]|nr:hypothetical protein [Candidatus Binatia bacterium]